MKAIIEITKRHLTDGGCLSPSRSEFLDGVTIREVRLLGLKILSKIETTLVTEVRLLRLVIMRSRQQGWVICLPPKSKP